jgi:hypothetical protein
MTDICSITIAGLNNWVERNSRFVINDMTYLSATAVNSLCRSTRRTAVKVDDLINTTDFQKLLRELWAAFGLHVEWQPRKRR